MLQLREIRFHPETYPTDDCYPFHLSLFQKTDTVVFEKPVSFFVGENGTGKSTLLEAIAHRCRIHIWEDTTRRRAKTNLYETELYRCIHLLWADGHDGPVTGSFFASQIFHHFTQVLDEWIAADPGLVDYFGGQSLLTQSHGQSLMSFFHCRFSREGLYLVDEPETALSARRQIELVRLLRDMAAAGHAQFIIATHSPILLACPDAQIFTFDDEVIHPIEYEQTDHFQTYRNFLNHRSEYL
ncbi:MAG: AAA family ATPase [Sedimentisphaerales bacterium]|nr:AAA family ATPase [Sedimentisphaerales bacterium]